MSLISQAQLAKSFVTKNWINLTSLPDCTVTGQQHEVSQSGTITICIVGGITYGEIAACRLMEKSSGSRFVFASDVILTGNQLVESIKNA